MKVKETANLIQFDFGDRVEFDIKQGKDTGIVCEITLRSGSIIYLVCWSDKKSTSHYGFELKKI